MYRDFLQRGEKVRIVHNVQEVAIVEDTGGNVPGIYATLDNKKNEF
jgi:hypothetical protein